jgi:predicted GH43/DUF377 family glycosyl hydrolase
LGLQFIWRPQKKDFNAFEHHGIIFRPNNKNVLIFPKRIDGKYYVLHRPASTEFKSYEIIWTAESPDLNCWGNHRCLMGLCRSY